MRILFVSSRFPWPPWRGNQLRTAQWLEALAENDILLMCPPATDGEKAGDFDGEIRFLPDSRVASSFGAAVALVRGLPIQEGLFATGSAKRLAAEAAADWRPDLAVIQMVRCGWAADAIQSVAPELPILFDAIDCMALHYHRAASSVRAVLRPAYNMEAERCRRRENELVGRARVTTAVSGRDLRALGTGSSGMVVTVSGGTEVDRDTPPAVEPTVLLSGNLGYRPTVSAALWFADRIWPKVREAVPSACWILAGARPAAAVRRLSSRPGIELHSDVEDLGPFLQRARVAVAPMASGSGVPIKILEALAAGVPVVADPWSAAGLMDPEAVLVADGEAAWVDGLRRLLLDPKTTHEQAERGAEAWRVHYHPSQVGSRIRDAASAAVSPVG